MNLPQHLPVEMLGPIGRATRGRVFAAALPAHDGIDVYTEDGRWIAIRWRSDGAELGGVADGVPTPSQRSVLRGKVLDNAFTRDGLFILLMKDGHALRFDWHTGQPREAGIDCYVRLPDVVGRALAAHE